ncbi:MAG TPA: type II toxin-antitoxin system VapC family toxin [Stellaceae bacterium]|jgi:PIN domain nuclease of toxin-antitoxin system|nr:type II toxin-antitoxin system VapC family toxin [Stellaceae bacterium]
MKLLLDTHLLLWSAVEPELMPRRAQQLIDDPENKVLFSAANLWEVAIKQRRGRLDFNVDARLLRRNLLNSNYEELPVTGEHAVAVADLPVLHKDPFDRLLVAQCIVEGITLLTADRIVAQYPGPIERV